MSKKRTPLFFSPKSPPPLTRIPCPLGLVKKFVPDTGLNDRIIDVVSWWSARKNRVLALNFHGFDGVLETVRNLYHMLPLYARKRFGFITYAPDPQEGCAVRWVQYLMHPAKRQGPHGGNKPAARSGEIDFAGGHTLPEK